MALISVNVAFLDLTKDLFFVDSTDAIEMPSNMQQHLTKHFISLPSPLFSHKEALNNSMQNYAFKFDPESLQCVFNFQHIRIHWWCTHEKKKKEEDPRGLELSGSCIVGRYEDVVVALPFCFSLLFGRSGFCQGRGCRGCFRYENGRWIWERSFYRRGWNRGRGKTRPCSGRNY